MNQVVRTEHKGDILVITIDRPRKLNAVDMNVYSGVEQALEMEAQGYVITGTGGNFTVGGDLSMIDFPDYAAADAYMVRAGRILQKIETMPRPVVAAVDGYALGVGFEWAIVCDAVFATPRAVFGLPETPHGNVSITALGRATDVIGRGMVRHLALTGLFWLNGDEAHRLGMVAEIHPPEELVDESVRLAVEMAANENFIATKRLLNINGHKVFQISQMVSPQLMVSGWAKEIQRRFKKDD